MEMFIQYTCGVIHEYIDQKVRAVVYACDERFHIADIESGISLGDKLISIQTQLECVSEKREVINQMVSDGVDIIRALLNSCSQYD
jgi:hypothetical protein